jgi:hypothetical protein
MREFSTTTTKIPIHCFDILSMKSTTHQQQQTWQATLWCPYSVRSTHSTYNPLLPVIEQGNHQMIPTAIVDLEIDLLKTNIENDMIDNFSVFSNRTQIQSP